MSQQSIFIIAAVSVLFMVYMLITRSSLREKYAAFWILTAVSLFAFAIFPDAVAVVGHKLSFEATSNFVFGIIILMLLSLVMLISLEVGRLDDKIQTLAEENALIAHQMASMVEPKD